MTCHIRARESWQSLSSSWILSFSRQLTTTSKWSNCDCPWNGSFIFVFCFKNVKWTDHSSPPMTPTPFLYHTCFKTSISYTHGYFLPKQGSQNHKIFQILRRVSSGLNILHVWQAWRTRWLWLRLCTDGHIGGLRFNLSDSRKTFASVDEILECELNMIVFQF